MKNMKKGNKLTLTLTEQELEDVLSVFSIAIGCAPVGHTKQNPVFWKAVMKLKTKLQGLKE